MRRSSDMQGFAREMSFGVREHIHSSGSTQQQVSETLRHMGLSVDEVRCPKSGYSIDMLVHDSPLGMGGEISSGVRTWAVEVDGPSHFLASKAPTGASGQERGISIIRL